MSEIYFTMSLNQDDYTIDDAGLSDELKNIYIQAFTILSGNPYAVDETLTVFENYYEEQALAAALAESNVTSEALTTVYTSVMTNETNVVQLDIDGNLVVSNNQAVFANTKEESKNILGSVDRINANEILIADAVNKRAIIVDVLTQKVKWEYRSDKYVIDAHMVLKDNITIKINRSNYDSSDIIVNQGQIVIWENNMGFPITIYSGDIEGVNLATDFDEDLYGDVFKSITLEDGERWSYRFDLQGEQKWFSYPNGFSGTIISSSYKISSDQQFIILESDGLESPFTGRAIKIDCWGNILWSCGEGFLVKPRDARTLLNGQVLIST
jgi:hypothetical protein